MSALTDFFNQYSPYIQSAASQSGVSSETIAAQWANESGYGKSKLAVDSHNLAGIKYSPHSTTAKRIPGSDFAAYDSYADFVTDYVRVLNLPYYDKVRAAGTDTQAATKALGESPWDAGHYNNGSGPGSKLFSILGSGTKMPTQSSSGNNLPQSPANAQQVGLWQDLGKARDFLTPDWWSDFWGWTYDQAIGKDDGSGGGSGGQAQADDGSRIYFVRSNGFFPSISVSKAFLIQILLFAAGAVLLFLFLKTQASAPAVVVERGTE